MQSGVLFTIRPDGRQSETAAIIQKGVCRHFRAQGFAALCEFTLASGRRADVIAMGPRGDLWIVEIKSSPEDFRADHKWPDYRDYCDRLYFAVTASMDQSLLPRRCRTHHCRRLRGGNPASPGRNAAQCRKTQSDDNRFRPRRGDAAARPLRSGDWVALA